MRADRRESPPRSRRPVRNGKDHGAAAASSSASARSSRVVILRLRASRAPAGRTARSASTSAASSVAAGRPRRPRTPAPAGRRGKPCGVCARQSRVARDGAASRESGPSARCFLQRVAHRHRRDRALAGARVADDGVDHAPARRTAGRRRAPARSRSRSGSARSPAATESLRSAPPATIVKPEPDAAARGRPAASSASSGGRTSTTWATSGWAAKGRSARSSIGHAGDRAGTAWAISPPSRLPRPAATTTTPTSRGKRPHQLLDVVEPDQRDAGDL